MAHKTVLTATALAFVLIVCSAQAEQTERSEDSGVSEGGRYYTAEGEPTYHFSPDGGVDWYTFNGYRRYHADCHVCHGPSGGGSTFAPSLMEPMKAMSFETFRDIVARGLRTIGPSEQRVMRAMGGDRNVMCYLDDLYVYLKARADGALGRGRPEKHQSKPDATAQHEAACLGPRESLP